MNMKGKLFIAACLSFAAAVSLQAQIRISGSVLDESGVERREVARNGADFGGDFVVLALELGDLCGLAEHTLLEPAEAVEVAGEL